MTPSASHGKTLPAITTSTSAMVSTTAGSNSAACMTSPVARKIAPTTTGGMTSARPSPSPTRQISPAAIAPPPAAATGRPKKRVAR